MKRPSPSISQTVQLPIRSFHGYDEAASRRLSLKIQTVVGRRSHRILMIHIIRREIRARAMCREPKDQSALRGAGEMSPADFSLPADLHRSEEQTSEIQLTDHYVLLLLL